MLRFLPPPLRGIVAASLLGLNTLFWCGLLFALALVKLVLPVDSVRAVIDRALNGIATRWVAGNSGWMRLTQRTEWEVAGLDGLEYRAWYMVNCNHQSWVDILVLQHLLNKRIPMLKFFLKQQLIYVPVIGCLVGAGFSVHEAAFHRLPQGASGEAVRGSRRHATRLQEIRTHSDQRDELSRRHAFPGREAQGAALALPAPAQTRAGAMALALAVLGDKFDALLDVTIVYPAGAPTFWQFLCGDMPRVVVRARRTSIPRELREGDYAGDPKFRKTFQRWLESLWREKDALIEAL